MMRNVVDMGKAPMRNFQLQLCLYLCGDEDEDKDNLGG